VVSSLHGMDGPQPEGHMASYIGRRKFLAALLGGAASWPLAARAQQPGGIRRIGVLMPYTETDLEGQGFIAAFREGLQQLGWHEGRNIRIDTRWAAPGEAESTQRFAQELVALQPELIFANGTPAVAPLLQHTRTIPIIFANVADPVGSGFVASFSRPGGNVTGFITMEGSIAGKWLELLKELSPSVARVAFVLNPAMATYAEYYLNPFKAARRPSQWRRSSRPFTTRPNSYPTSPHSRASRMVA
jgi:putative tryptophan/tyrosine transport system substrate-binding protein